MQEPQDCGCGTAPSACSYTSRWAVHRPDITASSSWTLQHSDDDLQWHSEFEGL